MTKDTSLWTHAWRRLLQNRLAMLGLGYLLVQVFVAVFAPWIVRFPFAETDFNIGAVAPNWVHWFGTDDMGRDLFARIVYGSRVSLMVGVLATAVSVIIGVLYGAIAGYVGGRIDGLMMRFLEVLFSLPFIFFVIILMVMFGRSIYLLFIALGLIEWMTMARIVRGQVLSLRKLDYIDAARAMGVGHWGILWKHLIPNVMGTVVVYITLTVPGLILQEAFLSFLGFGVQEPMSSWGTLIADGVNAMQTYPWMLFFPSLMFMLTLLALNFLGDGLRDALDPRSQKI